MSILFDQEKVWEMERYHIQKESEARGEAKGRVKGRAEGRAEGRAAEQVDTIQKLIKVMDHQKIAEVLQLPLDYVRSVADGRQ